MSKKVPRRKLSRGLRDQEAEDRARRERILSVRDLLKAEKMVRLPISEGSPEALPGTAVNDALKKVSRAVLPPLSEDDAKRALANMQNIGQVVNSSGPISRGATVSYAPGGLLPGAQQIRKGGTMEESVANRLLYESQNHLDWASDDIGDRVGSIVSAYQIGNSAAYRVFNKDWDFCMLPVQDGRFWYMGVAFTPDVLKAMRGSTIQKAQTLGTNEVGAVLLGIGKASTTRPGPLMSQVLSYGAESAMLSDSIHRRGEWMKTGQSLSIHIAPALEAVISPALYPEGSRLGEVKVDLHWGNRGPSMVVSTKVPVSKDVTYSLHDLLLKVLGARGAPPLTGLCAHCGEKNLHNRYEKMLDDGVRSANVLYPILMRDMATCPKCADDIVSQGRRTLEYLNEGAVPEF